MGVRVPSWVLSGQEGCSGGPRGPWTLDRAFGARATAAPVTYSDFYYRSLRMDCGCSYYHYEQYYWYGYYAYYLVATNTGQVIKII